MYRYIAIFILLFSKNVLALDCDGEFDQSVIVENKALKWSYTTNGKLINGETLLHTEHGSFSIIAGEHESCMDAMTCSTHEFACAISIALTEPYNSQLRMGRMQVDSYGLYLKARGYAVKIKDCSRAYSKYYSEVENFWIKQLSKNNGRYSFVKIFPREIKMSKPPNLAENCFEETNKPPALWFGIDYFPIIVIEGK